MDEEKMIFKVMNEEGKEVECEVLFTFESEETKKNYIVYTDNTLDESGNVEVYASIYNPEDPNTKLEPIETEKEWKIIDNILASVLDMVKEKQDEFNDEEENHD